MKAEKERVLKWIEDNPFMTVGELMLSYAQHVTSEKDKEIERLQSELEEITGMEDSGRLMISKSDLQRLKEENERLRGAVEDAVTGLEWLIEDNPFIVSEADYEKLDEWKELLTPNPK